MPTKSPDLVLGEAAVAESMVSREELEAALEAQRLAPASRTLGDVMLEMQLLTPSQLDRLHELTRTNKPPTSTFRPFPTNLSELFGHLAMERGYVTLQQVDECLAEQKRLELEGQQMRLGQIMIRKRYLTTDNFLEILKLQEEMARVCAQCGQDVVLTLEQIKSPPPCTKCGGTLERLKGRGSSGSAVAVAAPSSRLANATEATLRVSPPARTAPASPSSRKPYPTPLSPLPRLTPFPGRSSTPRTPLPSVPTETEGKPFGRYRLMEPVGKGGGGTVYRALDIPLNRVVALKMLRATDGADATQLTQFVREAKTAARLNHPGILTIHEVGTIEDAHYYTMEYVEGQTLDKLLAERRLSREHALEVLEKVARAVDYAHSCGVVHRDLKPANIVIDRQGQPRIMDFGVSPTPASNRRSTGMDLPYYLSPEQVRGEEPDARADLYSLGVILYQILVGEVPFNGANSTEIRERILTSDAERPRERVPDIPMELEIVSLKALERDKSLRYASASEFADDVRRFLNGEPVAARPVSALARAVKKLQTSRISALLLITSLPLVLGLGYVGWRLKIAHDKKVEREKADDCRKRAQQKLGEADRLLQDLQREMTRAGSSAMSLTLKADQVIRLLGEALDIDKTFAEAQHQRGSVHLLLGRLDQAEADFTGAWTLDPTRTSALFERARLYLREVLLLTGRPLAVVGPSGETLELPEPESPVALAVTEKAVADFEVLADKMMRPEEKALISASLAALGKERRWTLALEKATAVPTPNPLSEDLSLLRARIASALKRGARESLREFDATLTQRTLLHEAAELCAMTPYRKQEIEWALRQVDRSLEEGKRTPDLYIARATLRMLLRRYSLAEQDCRAALAVAPNNTEALARRIFITLAQPSPDLNKAAQDAEQLTKIAENDPRGWLLRALISMDQATQLQRAISDAEQGQRKAGEDPFALYVLARAALLKGNTAASISHCTSALDTLQSFYPALDVRAEARLIDRNLPQAESDVRTALTIRKDYWRAVETRGRIYVERRRVDDALNDFKTASDLNPRAHTPYLFSGLARKDARRYTEALADFTKACDMRPDLILPRILRGWMHAVLNDEAKCDADFAWVYEKAPNDLSAMLYQCDAFIELERYAQAIELGDKIATLYPMRKTQADQLITRAKAELERQASDWQTPLTRGEEFIHSANREPARQMERYQAARREYEKGFLLMKGVQLTEQQIRAVANCQYNYACALAVTSAPKQAEEHKQDVDLAFTYLDLALKNGFGNGFVPADSQCLIDKARHSCLEHARHDPDFDSIRSDPRFQPLIDSYKPKAREEE